MAGTNDFLPLATGGSANVIDQATFAALSSLLSNGFQSGVANSAQINKVLRQSSFVASAVAKIIADNNVNALDDGDVAGFKTKLIAAIQASVSAAFASNAEAQAFSLTTKAISPATLAAAFQGSNQSLAANGYQKLPGGLIVQWGSIARTVSGDVTVTFPLTFPNAVYSAVSVPFYASPISNTWKISSMTTSGMVLNSANAAAGYYENWIAIGR